MAHLGNLLSLRKQHLLSEFTGLKQACPEGVFITLTPGDPTLWSAVLFVRDGPYAPAVLRFQISFPDTYPSLPPLVLFSTDIFHPLVSPLTTYMYTTDIQDNGTVSATDHERLPPGGFSLRHGFPEWFRRGKHAGSDRTNAPPIGSSATSPESPNANTPSYLQAGKPNVSIYSILKYVRSTFDSAEMLDSVPFAAAGNPGAWHAWRTHRLKQGKLSNQQPGTVHSTQPNEPSVAPAEKEKETLPSPNSAIRQPGEWNWDGVWEDRVKKGVAACLTEPVLYGGSGVPDEMIRFLPMEETDIESVKENIRRTLDSAA